MENNDLAAGAYGKPAGAANRLPVFHPINRELNSGENDWRRLVQLAVNEADALAWQSGVSNLVFIALAEEKVQAVKSWYARQQQLRNRSVEWALAA